MKRLWIPLLVLALTLSLLFRVANSPRQEPNSPESPADSEVSRIAPEPPRREPRERPGPAAAENVDPEVRERIGIAKVPFPGQESVEIRLRKPPRSQHPMRNELMANFDHYRELARDGDHEVSVKLSQAMQSCEILAPGSEEGLEQAIDQLYQTRTLPLAVGGSVDFMEDEDIHDMADRFRQMTRNCWQVGDEDRVEAFTWIEAAARDDYLPALGELRSTQSGTKEEISTIVRMSELGDIHALHRLANAYRNGRGVETDSVRAHAYDYLHSHIKTLDHQIYGNDGHLARASNRLKYLERIESRMRAYQIEEGHALAREILLAHPNCCVSWYQYEP